MSGDPKRIVVRYKTKPERAEENHRLVEKVFEELNTTDPGGVRYATVRLADDTFIHMVSIETDDGSSPLQDNAAFAEFQADIADRCIEPPNPQDAQLVGHYRFFAE